MNPLHFLNTHTRISSVHTNYTRSARMHVSSSAYDMHVCSSSYDNTNHTHTHTHIPRARSHSHTLFINTRPQPEFVNKNDAVGVFRAVTASRGGGTGEVLGLSFDLFQECVRRLARLKGYKVCACIVSLNPTNIACLFIPSSSSSYTKPRATHPNPSTLQGVHSCMYTWYP
jgi:hypothetical protein